MTPQAFLDLSTRLCKDLNAWVAEAHKSQAMTESDLALLNGALKIIDRVTLAETDSKQ